MNRNAYQQPLLASIHRNGAECPPNDLQQLSKAEKNLVAELSFCMLTCKDHIRYSHDKVTINLLTGGAMAGWEIANWSELSFALQCALTEVFSANKMLPPPINPASINRQTSTPHRLQAGA